jgi:nucleoside triphosphate pyrophosphatase
VIAENEPIAGSRAGMLVLASASSTRALLLRRAGVPFMQDPASIDETAIKVELRRSGRDALQAALELAQRKAAAVARKHPQRLVLGADQLLECEGKWFDKPVNRAQAREQLLQLSGRRHRLATAAVLLRGEAVYWSDVEAPELVMRSLSRELIDAYLDAAGETALNSVGAYQIEGPGAQLMESMTGDFFTILGLPMLPLLAALRREGVLP